jgi:hypothetical protein
LGTTVRQSIYRHEREWQFTKGTSFEQVRTVLEDLHCLSQEQGKKIQTVYIDDCCRLRSKIQSIFGTTVAVKLDLFHAIQRLSKRHALYHQCLMDLRQVFRQNSDSGERRMADTPPEEITITEFCEK